MEPQGEPLIEMEPMSIDQFAGSVVLILGAVGSLLLVVWQSRCGIHCRLGCSDNCYLCDCKRDPPPTEGASEEGAVAQANVAKRESVEIQLTDEEITEGTFPSRLSQENLIPAEPEPEPEIITK